MNIERIRKIVDDADTYERQYAAALIVALREELPVGRVFRFFKGGAWRRVEVVRHNSSFRSVDHPAVYVRNTKTGREYWVTAYDILRRD